MYSVRWLPWHSLLFPIHLVHTFCFVAECNLMKNVAPNEAWSADCLTPNSDGKVRLIWLRSGLLNIWGRSAPSNSLHLRRLSKMVRIILCKKLWLTSENDWTHVLNMLEIAKSSEIACLREWSIREPTKSRSTVPSRTKISGKNT